VLRNIHIWFTMMQDTSGKFLAELNRARRDT
jgi:hypothetical protein